MNRDAISVEDAKDREVRQLAEQARSLERELEDLEARLARLAEFIRELVK